MVRIVTLFALMGASQAKLRESTATFFREAGDKFSDVIDLFENWMAEHEKVYETAEEEMKRVTLWFDNHRLIEKHNNKVPRPNFLLGHNQFSDMTNKEYQEYNKLGAYSPAINKGDSLDSNVVSIGEEESTSSRLLDELPKEVNWVEKGAVTRVKNQGKCGSCWAFSTVASIEGAYQLKTGKLVDLSEQQLVDCDSQEMGCKGGILDRVFQYEETQNGLCAYDDYPYVAKKETCTKCEAVEGTRIASYVDVHKSEAGLMSAIAVQPTAVAIQANQLMFQLYKSGVFDHLCFQSVDHGVLAAGYGTDEETGLDYWLVKNSWGEKWGSEGYIKIARNAFGPLGRCGIQRMASRPILED